VLYASQGQYEKARQQLEMSIRTDPRFATAYENLGDVYTKLASQAYDKALQLDSSNSRRKKQALADSRLVDHQRNPSFLRRDRLAGKTADPAPPPAMATTPKKSATEVKPDRCKGRICGSKTCGETGASSRRQHRSGAADGARLGRRVVQKERGKLSRLLRPGFQDAEGRRPLAMGSLTQGNASPNPKSRGRYRIAQGYVSG